VRTADGQLPFHTTLATKRPQDCTGVVAEHGMTMTLATGAAISVTAIAERTAAGKPATAAASLAAPEGLDSDESDVPALFC
jgi:hypothetical protein